MSQIPPIQPPSRLLAALREGVSLVQMVLFKEVRANLASRYPDQVASFLAMLAGAITNELFGTRNPDEKFVRFREDNQATIEQELLALATHLPQLRNPLTDALRIQVLCDSQEGTDSSAILIRASDFGALVTERDIPLPSLFMTTVRTLGEKYGLVIAPAPIAVDGDQIIH